MNHSASSRHHLLPAARGTRVAAVTAGLAAVALVAAGCTGGDEPASATANEAAFFHADAVHTVAVEFDEDDYQAMLDAYAESEEKDWITATVTIDGTTFENVGLRLKGNSSLRGLGGNEARPGAPGAGEEEDGEAQADEEPSRDEGDGDGSADDPASLPWLIRLDKYVDGQQYAGRSDFVVRGNNTESSLNEAVALHVLDEAGVAAEDAAYVRLSVNGGDERLRLVLDVPDDDAWNEDAFGGTGITYKADASGDYSYRGDDSAEYLDVFDVKFDAEGLSEEEQYAPLIDFLDFINNSSDEEFAEQLSDYLDVDSFADYLAVQDLVANSDDIDGPGNNSYLHYDPDTDLMTVVAWDQNLSYGGLGGGGFGAPGGDMPQRDGEGMPEMPEGAEFPEGFEPPEGMELPEGAELPDDLPQGGRPGGMMGGENVLAMRFLENADFAQLYDDSLAEHTEAIYDSGSAQEYLDGLVALLSEQADDLIDADTLQSEADSISQTIAGEATGAGSPTGGSPDPGATEAPAAEGPEADAS
ncbi:CotH kinase family protein [Microbacterium nanhaiense]|uniref:CotH kinase family protein n=1 Tax=Microbacterium nanhaiense TaxID=1301026 RepID=UPI00166D2694|nr:CotH kinase family protein [Microbacterium nanhaiense]